MRRMISRSDRRWQQRIDAFLAAPGRVHRWTGWRDPQQAGEIHHIPTLVVVLEGGARVHRSGQDLDLGPGEALVIGPGVWHRHRPAKAGSALFQQGFVGLGSDIVLHDSEGKWHGLCPSQPSRRLMEALLACDDDAGRRSRLIDLLRAIGEGEIRPAPRADEAAQAMLHRMWRDLHLGVQARDLVAASGLSTSRAYEVFKAAYGLPPQQAILEARRSLAEGLIAAGLSVNSAAACAGFADHRALARRRRLATSQSI
jgi:AraC-like DNA-binding protein